MNGIDLYNHHVSLMTAKPYSLSNKDGGGKPIRITIYDVKMHYRNESVEKNLKGIGAKLIKEVSYCKV